MVHYFLTMSLLVDLKLTCFTNPYSIGCLIPSVLPLSSRTRTEPCQHNYFFAFISLFVLVRLRFHHSGQQIKLATGKLLRKKGFSHRQRRPLWGSEPSLWCFEPRRLNSIKRPTLADWSAQSTASAFLLLTIGQYINSPSNTAYC